MIVLSSASLAILISLPVRAAEEPLTGRDLALLMDQVDDSDDSVSEALMTITRGDKTLTRSFSTYSKVYGDDERSLIVFGEPADVKDTKYLVWSYFGLDKTDDIWVFLPAESLVRRISGSSKHASFMRSDLANEDIQNNDDVEEYDYVLHGSEVIDGIDCYVLERIPKPEKDTQYSRQMQWVRKDNLLRLKSNCYNKKNQLIKTFYFDKSELIDDIWTVTKLRIERDDKTSITVIDWNNLKYNVDLKDDIFEHNQMQR
jgi:hypothetical protein